MLSTHVLETALCCMLRPHAGSAHSHKPLLSSLACEMCPQAAVGAVRCYLALHDAPAAAAAAEAAADAELAALSPEERKKEKLRRKKVRERGCAGGCASNVRRACICAPACVRGRVCFVLRSCMAAEPELQAAC